MMRKLINYLKTKGDAGLSLIELIISMAILAIVGIAVGGAMYVSSRSYTRSSTEVNVQEEAQVASNLICDWLVDATSVNPEDAEVTLDPSGSNDFVIVHPDGDATVTIRIFLDDNELKYSAEKKTTQDDGSVVTESSAGTLANNVYNAVFNSTFKDDRNVKFSMDFKVNDRNYNAVTDSTSRNHSFVSTTGTASPDNLYIMPNNVYPLGSDEYQVILEPGQRKNGAAYDASYTFDFLVYGLDEHTQVLMEGATDPDKTKGDIKLSYAQVSGTANFNVTCQCTDNAKDSQVFTFTAVNTTDPSINHSIRVHVDIRRANQVTFNYGSTGIFKASGDEGKSGSTYYAEVDLGVQYGASVNAFFDKNGGYKNPYEVKFFYKMKNGSSYVDIDPNTYFENLVVTNGTSGGNANIGFKLKNDIDKDIYIVAVAVHSGYLPDLGASNAGVVFASPTNRVTEAMGSGFSYGTSNVAYYNVLKIAAAGPHHEDVTLPNPSSIKRGTPSFEIGRITTEGYNAILTAVTADCEATYGDSYPNNHQYEYKSVVYYKEKGSSTWSYYVIHSTREVTDIKQHAFTQFQEAKESYIFAADKSYDYYLSYVAIAPDGDIVKEVKSDEGSIPASRPYVYDPNDQTFKLETYSSGHPMEFDVTDYRNTSSDPGNVRNYDFYVYFSNMTSANVESTHITWVIEKFVIDDAETGAGHWTTDTSLVVWQQGYEATSQLTNANSNGIGSPSDHSTYHTNSSNGITQIKLAGVDHTSGDTLSIGAYNENRYPDSNMSVACLRLSKDNIKNENIGQYRLSFGGDDSYWTPTTMSSGSVTYGGSTGSVTSVQRTDCDMTQTTVNGTEYGYIYFTIKD